MNNTTKKVITAALLAAICCVATMTIKVPSFKGYINFGDCAVLLCGFILSPIYAFLAAGTGSALADLFGGYITYVPVTFFIKGVMAVISFYGYKALHTKLSNTAAYALSSAAAEIFMVVGYYVFEGFLYGFVPSAVNIVGNGAQGVIGLTLGIVLIKLFKTRKIVK